MTETGLANVRIVLVEPAGPLNVGSVARVMKNMGLSHLVLVQPHCDPFGEEARRMAVRGVDVLEAAQVVETLPEALVGCQRSIATTGRTETQVATLEHPRIALPWLVQPDVPDSSALIFGPEDRGLNNVELNYAQRLIYIPSNPAYPSLNLAQAVAICCYELYQFVCLEPPEPAASEKLPTLSKAVEGKAVEALENDVGSPFPIADSRSSNLPPLEVIEGYYQHLESVLLKIGYLYPHTAASRMKKIRRLLNRALPSVEEMALLRGILSQVEWAIQQRIKNCNSQDD